MNPVRATDGGSHVILVVDDDSAVRDSLKFMIEVEGFEVNVYSSAHELLNDHSVPANSCLVTDYQMPDMNGLELVAQLRARQISIPAILITANPTETLHNSAAAAGISIIDKPLLGSRLLEAIRKAFDGPKNATL
jgi:two-component system, LuxR family, response regulator FixJ